MANKSKLNSLVPERDLCQTPGYAIEPLLPHIDISNLEVLDPCAGAGYLARALLPHAAYVHEQDVDSGVDFYSYYEQWDAIITNPPFSHRDTFLAHALTLSKRVAFLMPTESVSLKWMYKLIQVYGEPGVIWFSPRINFHMPHEGWAGTGAQFPCAWFTWGWFTGQRFEHMRHWTKEYRVRFELESDYEYRTCRAQQPLFPQFLS